MSWNQLYDNFMHKLFYADVDEFIYDTVYGRRTATVLKEICIVHRWVNEQYPWEMFALFKARPFHNIFACCDYAQT